MSSLPMVDYTSRTTMRRNLAGFWLLGLTNNYAYVIMLSAAVDILRSDDQGNGTVPENGTTIAPLHDRSGHLVPHCNAIGTGAVLLADILPSLLIKLSAPFYMHKLSYNFRVILVILLGAASFPIVATSTAVWLSLLGVVCASLGAGFGEVTFLSLSAHFDKNVVSTWSSGTGGAGLFGSLSYLGLRAAGLNPPTILYIMLIIPVIMFVSYFFLLVIPRSAKFPSTILARREAGDTVPIIDPEDDFNASEDSVRMQIPEYSLLDRIILCKSLLRYMIPLVLVYFAEYFINQALFELVYFEDIWLSVSSQYVWYQAIYQMGVFISRSSVNLFQIKYLWIMPILQFGIVALMLCQIFFHFIPSIWIVFIIILFEGFLGGGTYVNAFYSISEEVPPEHLEFSMGVTSLADSSGITLAGIISVPVHNAICSL